MRAVRGPGRDEARHAPRFVDPLLQNLPGGAFEVRGRGAAIDGAVELPFAAVHAEGGVHRRHAEGLAFVRHNRHDELADGFVPHDALRHEIDPSQCRRTRLDGGGVEKVERLPIRRRTRREFLPAARVESPERCAALHQVFHLGAIGRGLVKGDVGELVVGERKFEAVAESAEGRDHAFGFLLIVGQSRVGFDRTGEHFQLVRGVLPFAAVARNAVAFDRLDQNHRRLALAIDRRFVRRVNLDRVVSAAAEVGDLFVAEVLDHRLEFGGVEEVLADPLPAFDDVLLVFAVDHFHHPALQGARVVGFDQIVPAAAPDHFDDVPAGAAEEAFELLNDLAVAADRPVEALQIAIDDPGQVVELLPGREGDAAEAFGFVALAIAKVGPNADIVGLRQPAVAQIAVVPGVVDAHDRTEAHADGRILPERGHEPRVRVTAEAAARLEFLAEVRELRFVQPAFEKRACVRPGAGVPLEEHDVAGVIGRAAFEEVVLRDLIQGRGAGERADVPADVGVLVRLQHHRHRVPPDQRLDLAFQRTVAGERRLVFHRDRVDIRRGDAAGHHGGALAQLGHLRNQRFEQELGAVRAAVFHDRFHRIQPLGGFLGVVIVGQTCGTAGQDLGANEHTHKPHQ